MKHYLLVLFLLIRIFGHIQAQQNALDFGTAADNAIVTVPNNANLSFDINDDLTIEFWIKTSTAGSSQVLVSKISNPAVRMGYEIQLANSSDILATKFASFFSGATIRTQGANLNDGVWHHVAVVMQGSDALNYNVYVDGQAQSAFKSGIVTGTIANSSDLTIGGDTAGRYFEGQLDEIRIWNVARSCEEIGIQRACALGGTEPGLVAWYDLNQGTAGGNNMGQTTMLDRQTNVPANDGTLNGFTLMGANLNWIAGFNTISCSTVRTVQEMEVNDALVGTDIGTVTLGQTISKTYSITNTGDADLKITNLTVTGAEFTLGTPLSFPIYLTTNASRSFEIIFSPPTGDPFTGSVSIANNDCDENPYTFPIKGTGTKLAGALDFDGLGDQVEIPDNGVLDLVGDLTIEAWVRTTKTTEQYILSKNNDSYALAISPTGVTSGRAAFRVLGSAPSWLPGFTNVADGNWHHIVGVRTGSLVEIYIDGNLENVGVASGVNSTGSNPLSLGTQSNTNFLEGQLDEVRIWKRAKLQADIRSQKDCQLNGQEDGLVAYYSFEQGQINTNNPTETRLRDLTTVSNDGNLLNFGLSGTTSNWVAGNNGVHATCPGDVLLRGNLLEISNGDTSPDVFDNTDWEQVAADGSGISKTFQLTNNGSSPLTLGSLTSNNSTFTVSGFPSALNPNTSGFFTVTFSPNTTGPQSATLLFTSNDADETPFSFTVEGEGVSSAGGLDFDGMDDYVRIPSSSSLRPGTDFTVEAWINLDQVIGIQNIVSHRDDGGGDDGWFLRTNGDKVEFGVNNAANLNQTVTSTAIITANAWFHIAGSYAADGTLSVYVNTTPETAIANGNVEYDVTSFVDLGIQGNGLNQAMGGKLDEVRIWNIVRSQTDLVNTLLTGLVGNEAGLVAYYNFEQGIEEGTNSSETTLDDQTSNSLDGTLINFGLSGVGSNWVAGSAVVSALPVELAYFRGYEMEQGNSLEWQTLTETNNEGFWVQQSFDGKAWNDMEFINGQGNSLATQDYSFVDVDPKAGINYYRLQQLDFDGQYEYSPIVAIETKGSYKILKPICYPNPVKDQLTIQWPSKIQEMVDIHLFNSNGQLVEHIQSLDLRVQIDLEEYPQGIYWLEIIGSNQRWIEKVVLK